VRWVDRAAVTENSRGVLILQIYRVALPRFALRVMSGAARYKCQDYTKCRQCSWRLLEVHQWNAIADAAETYQRNGRLAT
jgi:hypothetical protein